MAQSISDSIAILFHFLTLARAAADSPVTSLRDSLSKASKALTPWLALPNTDEAQALAYFIDTTTQALGKVGGFDGEAGAAACRRVEGLIMADLVEDPFSIDDVTKLVAEYKSATKTKGSRSTGAASTVEDLGFTVKVKHEASGEIVGSTTKDNLNSLRDQVRKFHGTKTGTKPSKGEPVWQGITDALEAVMHKGSQSAQGGGYIVDKAA